MKDEMSFSGRVALVTGSTSGIGLTIACTLAEHGATVLMHGLGDADTVQSAQAMIRASTVGEPVRHFASDLTKPQEIKTLFDTIADDYGVLDILVNNAGMQYVAPIHDFPSDMWDQILAVNVSAAFHTIRLGLPLMRRNGWGRIINIASVSGLIGAPGKSAYVSSKHALIGLTKAVALETATTPITCNAICPGWIHTPLVEKQIQARMQADNVDYDQATKRLLIKQPSQAFVSREQIAALVMYFLSDDAAQTRGVAWNIDGGYVAT